MAFCKAKKCFPVYLIALCSPCISILVLDVKANVALLVSKNVLEAIPYHSEQKR